MTWIETVQAVIDQEQVSLAEFIVLDQVRAGFPMTPDVAVQLAMKVLGPGEPAFRANDYRTAIGACFTKQWLSVLSKRQAADEDLPEDEVGTLRLTPDGALIIEKIRGALSQLR
jgi:hypothetical protein